VCAFLGLRASGDSHDADQADQSVHDSAKGEELSADVGELQDEPGRGLQVSLLLRLVPEEDGFSAGTKPRGQTAHFTRRHLRHRCTVVRVGGTHGGKSSFPLWLGRAVVRQHCGAAAYSRVILEFVLISC
jgi:hypothetical protein